MISATPSWIPARRALRGGLPWSGFGQSMRSEAASRADVSADETDAAEGRPHRGRRALGVPEAPKLRFDVLGCGGRLRLIALIDDPSVVERR